MIKKSYGDGNTHISSKILLSMKVASSHRNMHVLSKKRHDFSLSHMVLVVVLVLVSLSCVGSLNYDDEYESAVGDSGMRRDGLRLAIESWNQCNEVGEEAPNMGSPRAADCFDIFKASPQQGQFLSIFILIQSSKGTCI